MNPIHSTIRTVLCVLLAVALFAPVAHSKRLTDAELFQFENLPDLTDDLDKRASIKGENINTEKGDVQRAFDNAFGTNNRVMQNAKSGMTIVYTFTELTCVTAYSLKLSTDSNDKKASGRAPKAFTFEGFNETTQAWDLLGEETDQTGWDASNSEKRYFSVNSTRNSYKSYRWVLVQNNGDAWTTVGDLEFFRTADTSDMILYVVGDPQMHGTPDPAYGYAFSAADYQDGATLVCVGPVPTLSEDQLTRYTCIGWDVYAMDDNGEYTELVTTGTGTTASFAYSGKRMKLVWKFKHSYKVSVLQIYKGTATMLSEDPYVDEGATVDFSATIEEGVSKIFGWRTTSGTLQNAETLTPTLTVTEPADVIAIFIPIELDAPVQYVSLFGNDENEGFFESNPKTTIGAAVEVLNDFGKGSIFVSEGVYPITKPIQISHAISVFGCDGDPSRTVVSNTVVAGNANPYCRVFHLNHPQASLQNLTIKRGSLEKGDGQQLWIDVNGGVVSNCIITSAHVRRVNAASMVYLNSENAKLLNCEISDVTANVGEQAYMSSTYALKIDAGRAENCLIKNVKCGEAALEESDKSSKILSIGSKGRLINSTIVDCRSNDYVCNASTDNGNPTVINCAFIDNVTSRPNPMSGASALQACATDTEAVINDTCYLITAADFKDYANGDYTPAMSGVLRNRGVEVTLFSSLDFAGKPRVQGSKIDIGAFEAPAGGLRILVR